MPAQTFLSRKELAEKVFQIMMNNPGGVIFTIGQGVNFDLPRLKGTSYRARAKEALRSKVVYEKFPTEKAFHNSPAYTHYVEPTSALEGDIYDRPEVEEALMQGVSPKFQHLCDLMEVDVLSVQKSMNRYMDVVTKNPDTLQGTPVTMAACAKELQEFLTLDEMSCLLLMQLHPAIIEMTRLNQSQIPIKEIFAEFCNLWNSSQKQ